MTPATGCRYTLTPAADLAVFHAADAAHYRRTGRSDVLNLVTPQVFASIYEGCPSRGFAHDGQPIGGMLFHDGQPHIAVLPGHYGHWTPLLRPALDWLFGLCSEMRVPIEADNRLALAFMARNGWPEITPDAAEARSRPDARFFLVSRQPRPLRRGRPEAAHASNR
ncbi:GNAT family N-acetyltransferase [Xylophilus sp. GOD-11R]|uniref:GNAT family N-acetyltransferase n=1 Tax=Xylophilus sp. GOD-11R TaxID=3089814 RepID=UPI00298C1898|nr:GNAT family N-acetyltransferase [Xylophilus sp. GOD-11R]WPB56263.1 GNAT family N-acetyltransferase [Xylophilus sp. GOD-11R]